MSFPYVIPTEVLIGGKKYFVKMENGMTGIGSRKYWINGVEQQLNCVTQSADLSKGNHFLYTINWRDLPWDKVDIFIHEDQLSVLDNVPEWMRPARREIPL